MLASAPTASDLPGTRTEIDHYNGHLVRIAGSEPCPVNRVMVDLIHLMERDHIGPDEALLGPSLSLC